MWWNLGLVALLRLAQRSRTGLESWSIGPAFSSSVRAASNSSTRDSIDSGAGSETVLEFICIAGTLLGPRSHTRAG